ncbi:hypothetical protein DLAC_03919 [Tieghemostelium lacteum]|uniref:KxDL domain-containing protein n=1 Tax=Tieghemostelium lacteum TaxID=361077 RepID=A0A152A128_TIELA|nr:hypothetical protein DLAC_03919 [Tieghemostelium lacteum]|eukprot:KYQ99951.1 hypothetical protein DLAC_03919 [Tieghemostelium lacteum]
MTEKTEVTASKTITQEILNFSNDSDVNDILNLQTEVLKKQYETNNTLNHFNEFSQQKFNQISADFEKNTKMIKEMKKDLDYIFKKTRSIHSILNEKFPNSVPQMEHIIDDEDDD